ncbi:hypothetical protein E1176_10755 [Fulvivirga sp. RKSG066]|uniref:hypothetical protein n=1 Tax=Fulvivirga aurantia TaxID=2529383 RepID=UPI0012BC75EA|nr:hypothetical protein [Fulvivirga aurantia]MTI21498.1 hypothetical protein [Fulvivirga aurantia]
MNRNQFLKISLLASLTLGLAPFYPEPHLLGKIRWIAGGGVGMDAQDYFDLLLHGLPWLLLMVAIILKFAQSKK